ncbi:class I SAM-dependent methyltransferase [Rubrolithibacter danxiaensis]|uniref:class I SAM-dependent methyltransferase n=1 Tax=Rubrolithibacter danxiaensis TaxID=3390805 RepID=UPI003BF8B8A2
MDIFSQALLDFYSGNTRNKLWLNTSYGEKEEMPLEVFFRNKDEMPPLELLALELCKGKTLDIGAGAGSHALILQNLHFDVTALDQSEGACTIMQKRGLKNVINNDIYNYNSEKYDTLLLLMNGIGLCGTISGFRSFLLHAKNLLKPGGQLLFDTSDISYLYEGTDFPQHTYYGEIAYQYEYKKQQGNWFNWIYIDSEMLTVTAKEEGWNTEMLFNDGEDQFLVRLSESK